MKNISIFGTTLLLFSFSAFAQTDAVDPYQWKETYAQRVSPNGKYIMAQDGFANTYLLSTETKEILTYAGSYPGSGNCVANNGTMVGESIASEQHAAFFRNGAVEVPPSLKSIGFSSLSGITPDGSRACGFMSNPKTGVIYVPFYCDIAPDGTVGEPVELPYPQRDFFGLRPYFVSAVCISDDGKTICGFLADTTGFFSYPVVFKQDEAGEWDYTLPTESLFNPDHMAIPKMPSDNLSMPQIYDFMDADKRKEWLDLYRKYLETDDPADEPFTVHPKDYYMTPEQEADYAEALEDYKQKLNAFNNAVDQYWKDLYKIGREEWFGGFMCISPDGKQMAVAQLYADEESPTLEADKYFPFIFDLENNTFKKYTPEVGNLLPTQILSDGTVLTVSAPTDFVPYSCYLLEPGKTEFTSFINFLEDKFPAYLPWIEDNLTMYGIVGFDGDTPIYDYYTISGMVSMSDNMETIAGGLAVNGGMSSYYYYDPTLGVNEIYIEPNEDDTFTVYNLNGINVLTTKEKSDINSLPKGIYIINGKKVII